MKKVICAVGCAALLLTTACSGLSKRAKEMVGDYYIPEVSEEQPLLELHGNGKCTARSVNPGVLTFTVEGRWNVENDSLTIKLKPETLQWEGDSTLIGNIPERKSWYVTGFDGLNVTLRDSRGITYVYHRRGGK